MSRISISRRSAIGHVGRPEYGRLPINDFSIPQSQQVGASEWIARVAAISIKVIDPRNTFRDSFGHIIPGSLDPNVFHADGSGMYRFHCSRIAKITESHHYRPIFTGKLRLRRLAEPATQGLHSGEEVHDATKVRAGFQSLRDNPLQRLSLGRNPQQHEHRPAGYVEHNHFAKYCSTARALFCQNPRVILLGSNLIHGGSAHDALWRGRFHSPAKAIRGMAV